jgi:hypothetical protein
VPLLSATVQVDLKVPKSLLASVAQVPATGESAAKAGVAASTAPAAASAAKCNLRMEFSPLGGRRAASGSLSLIRATGNRPSEGSAPPCPTSG